MKLELISGCSRRQIRPWGVRNVIDRGQQSIMEYQVYLHRSGDILLMVSDEVLVFDNLAGTIRLVVNVDPAEPQAFETAQRRL